MNSIRSRYPALDAVTHLSQHGPRPDAGLAASLLDLGSDLARMYAPAHTPTRMLCYDDRACSATRCPLCGDATTGRGPCDLCLAGV